MGSRTYDNDSVSNVTTDNRVGVAAEADGSIAAAGDIGITNNNQSETYITTRDSGNTTNTTTTTEDSNNTTYDIRDSGNTYVESTVARAAVDGVVSAFADNQAGLQGLIDGVRQLSSDARGMHKDSIANSQENLRIAAALSGDSVKSVERVALDSIASAGSSLRSALDANQGVAQDAFAFGRDTADIFGTATGDLNKLVATTGRDFLAGAQTLVKDVLFASQSDDAKNYQTMLSALVKIAAVIGVALVVPYLFRKG